MRVKACTDNVAWRVVDGEAVLVHAETSAYFGLNRSGTVLWMSLADGARTADELLEVLGAGNGMERGQERQDVEDFLQDLVRASLAVPDENGASAPSVDATSRRSDQPYEPPTLSPFGELEQLILSGE